MDWMPTTVQSSPSQLSSRQVVAYLDSFATELREFLLDTATLLLDERHDLTAVSWTPLPVFFKTNLEAVLAVAVDILTDLDLQLSCLLVMYLLSHDVPAFRIRYVPVLKLHLRYSAGAGGGGEGIGLGPRRGGQAQQ